MIPNLEHILPNKFVRENSRERRQLRLSKTNFVDISDFPVSTKEQIRQNLINEGYNPSYSGKDNGFYY